MPKKILLPRYAIVLPKQFCRERKNTNFIFSQTRQGEIMTPPILSRLRRAIAPFSTYLSLVVPDSTFAPAPILRTYWRHCR